MTNNKAALDKEIRDRVQDSIDCLQRVVAMHDIDPLKARSELLLARFYADSALWALARR